MRSLFSSEELETEEGETIFITASMGITDYNPNIGKDMDIFSMIKATKKALDFAKERGGNRIEYVELTKV